MVHVFFTAPLLMALHFSLIELPSSEKVDDSRIKQLLTECQQKRKAAGSFRVEYEVILDDKLFRERTTSRARCLTDGVDLFRIDLLDKNPAFNQTSVKTAKEVYYRYRANDGGFVFPLSLIESPNSSQTESHVGVGFWFVVFMAERLTSPLVLLDSLNTNQTSDLTLRLADVDADWINLEVARPWPPVPSWVPQTKEAQVLFQFRIDRKTGFAMEIKHRDLNGSLTTYTVKSLERNLAKPVNKEDLLKDLPLKEMKRFGFPLPDSMQKNAGQ